MADYRLPSSFTVTDINANVAAARDDGKRFPWSWKDPVSREVFSGTKVVVTKEQLLKQKASLPIFQFRAQLIHAVANNQAIVVVGETGSGKSTQMPQYLLEAGLVSSGGGRIACTQPRRVAAVSVAQRVAEELDCRLGDLVGYTIRFEDVSSPNTIIKYMTDGILVMECLRDPAFSAYGCVILDEAHERTLHTDVLLGLLKKAMRERPELKVIITSATLDIQKFASYFRAPMIKIPGENFPVGIEYLRSENDLRPLRKRAQQIDKIIQMAVDKVVDIHLRQPRGDILLFLPGKEEVETAISSLSDIFGDLSLTDVILLPVFAAMPFEAQCDIFAKAPPRVRKIVVATNIAETSITIDGIVYVIDTGLFKEQIHDRGIDTLKISVISQAQALQRSGRAGRTASGICYRMYRCQDFMEMPSTPAPAIYRNDLTSTVLILKSMGIRDICSFGFMDPPRREQVTYALKRLRDLGAVNERLTMITELGHKMAEFPLTPRYSKILISAAMMECSYEVATIVSMLSITYVFYRPKRKVREADEKRKQFDSRHGDHLTLLNVYNAWCRNGMDEKWSRENFIHQKEMEKAHEIRNQLIGLMHAHNLPILQNPKNAGNICKALATGYPTNVAVKSHSQKNGYYTFVDGELAFLHPSSSLCRLSLLPKVVFYNEVFTTNRRFIKTVFVGDESAIHS